MTTLNNIEAYFDNCFSAQWCTETIDILERMNWDYKGRGRSPNTDEFNYVAEVQNIISPPLDDFKFKIRIENYKFNPNGGDNTHDGMCKIFTNYNFYILMKWSIHLYQGMYSGSPCMFNATFNFIYPNEPILNYIHVIHKPMGAHNFGVKINHSYSVTFEQLDIIKQKTTKTILPMVYIDYLNECMTCNNIDSNWRTPTNIVVNYTNEIVAFFDNNKYYSDLNKVTALNNQCISLSKTVDILQNQLTTANEENALLVEKVDHLTDKCNHQQNQMIDFIKTNKILKIQLETSTDILEKMQMANLNL